MDLFQSFIIVATAAVVPLTIAAGIPLSIAYADRPPAGVKPMADIVEQLEQQGYGPFVEISFDDGHLEVEVYKKDAPYELAVDGVTGKVLAEHNDDAEPRPPRDALPLSKILRQLNKSGYTQIDELSFERRYWEIESLRDNVKHEIHVNPTTGEVLSDRLDD